MKLEDQLTSLEPSKRLKELGVKQNSQFYWNKNIINYKAFMHFKIMKVSISAFSVAELGELLHTEQEHDVFPYYVTTKSMSRTETKRNWTCYNDIDWIKSSHQEEADTEANARAKMLIYLIENKLMVI